MRIRSGTPLLLFILSACASATPPASPAPTRPVTAAPTPDASPPVETPPAVVTDPSPATATPGPAPLTEAPDAWQLLDLDADRVPGVSATRTYRELLAGREPGREVIVAVIDGGTDTTHVDLRDNLWRNPGEVAGNGADDDGNGYVDDIFGWNFIGGTDGRNVGHESLEVTRLHVRCQAGDPAPAGLTCEEIAGDFEEGRAETRATLQQILQIGQAYDFALPVLRNASGSEELTPDIVRETRSLNQDVQQARNMYLQLDAAGISPDIVEEAVEAYQGLIDYGYNPDFDARDIVGDNYADGTQRDYGNADVMGPDASHGTHVAGIIGAVRGNREGIDGIGASVRLMTVRAVPDGDERDKDIANAIRYAVDNGANIINMSFGKSHSPRKELVDAAIRYAQDAGVLMVHAAGNDGENLEMERNYPSSTFEDGSRADLWIEVGAANWMVDSLAAVFSNYGETKVDVFSPGVAILSTVPGGGYERQDGTSMAAPVVSGVAALLMAYFPDLSAAEVKRLILDSSVKYADRQVPLPGTTDGQMVPFGSLSVTGGVVNVYEAVRLALERM